MGQIDILPIYKVFSPSDFHINSKLYLLFLNNYLLDIKTI
jgi:hypothetical protein